MVRPVDTSSAEAPDGDEPEGAWPDPERVMAIGGIVWHGAMVENLLRVIFVELAGGRAGLVAGGQSASWTIEAIRAIVRASGEQAPPDESALLDVLARCSEAFPMRNRYVHGLWLTSDGGDLNVRSRRWSEHLHAEDASLEDANALQDELADLSRLLQNSSWHGQSAYRPLTRSQRRTVKRTG